MTEEDFIRHWPDIERVLDQHPEMWADYHTKESLYQDVVDRNIQVWGFGGRGELRVILFTRLVEYPAARVLHVMMGFGNSLDDLLPQIEATLENFGQATKCTLCEIVGREGWTKKLSHRFKRRAVVLVAPISAAKVN